MSKNAALVSQPSTAWALASSVTSTKCPAVVAEEVAAAEGGDVEVGVAVVVVVADGHAHAEEGPSSPASLVTSSKCPLPSLR